MSRNECTGILVNQGLGLSIFSPAERDLIHLTALDILEHIGVLVESEEAVDLFTQAGAQAGPPNSRGLRVVKIPQRLVAEALLSAPKTITFHGRRPEDDYRTRPARVGFCMFGECLAVNDPVTRENRPSVKKDCGDSARLADALPGIDIMNRSICSGDQPPESQPVHNLDAMMRNTTKHIVLGAGTTANIDTMIEVASIYSGGAEAFQARPTFSLLVCATSPLTLVRHCCDALIHGARRDLTSIIITMSLLGGTAPISIAGGVTQHHAEILSGLVLAQLARPGAPIMYGGCSTALDLKTGVCALGAPELGTMSAGYVTMARHVGLPAWCAGGPSDAKIPDAQVGYEYALNAFQAALAGANLIQGAGALDGGLTYDYAKLMMDHECLMNIRQVLQGIPVNEATLSYDLIAELGPGGNFLAHKSTFKAAKTLSKWDLFDRHPRENWKAKNPGDKTVTDRAYERALEILGTHRPALEPTPEQVAAVEELIRAHEARVVKG